MQEKLYNLLMQKDEITWQTIIHDLVRTGEMDPWDIDVSILSQRYIETIRKLQEHNFFLSGKVLLASAILLKLKSDRLVTEYIARLDNQLFPPEEFFEESGDDKRIVFDRFIKKYGKPLLYIGGGRKDSYDYCKEKNIERVFANLDENEEIPGVELVHSVEELKSKIDSLCQGT